MRYVSLEQSELEGIESELKSIKTQLENTQQAVVTLNEQLADALAANNPLEEEIARLQAVSAQKDLQVINLEEQIVALQKKVTELNDKLTACQENQPVDPPVDPPVEPPPPVVTANWVTPRVFPVSDPWYTEITSVAVHSKNETWKNLIGKKTTTEIEFGSNPWEGSIGGIPYNIVPANQPLVPVVVLNLENWEREYSDLYPNFKDNLPIPLDALRENLPNINENNYDHDKHLITVQLDEQGRPARIYEMWMAKKRKVNGVHVGWNCQHISIFDCSKTNPQRPILKTSADAAGLAIMPALFTARDVQDALEREHPDDRHLGHALRYTLATGHIRQAFILPATNWTPSNMTDPNTIPFGARLRLREDFNLYEALPGWAKSDLQNGHIDIRKGEVLVNTLKRYGMINCDNGTTMAIVGTPSYENAEVKWNDTEMASMMNSILVSDYDFLDGKIYTSENKREAVADTGLPLWEDTLNQ